MKRNQWQWAAAVVALAGISLVRPMPARAQDPIGKPVPRNSNLVDGPPDVGRYISLLNNFTGMVGVTLITGTGTDGSGNTLEWEAEVRLAQGIFLDQVGAPARKTFVTTQLDVFSGTGANRTQIHALHMPFHGPPNLTAITDPLFGPEWTAAVPDESLNGNAYTPLMTLDVANAEHHDTFKLGGTQEYQDAQASLHVEWTPVGPPYTWNSPKNEADFVGVFRRALSRIDFSLTTTVSATDTAPFTFKSNPEGQQVVFAQVGHETNGLFVTPGYARTTPSASQDPLPEGKTVPKENDLRFSWPGVGRFVSLVDNFTGIVGVVLLAGTGTDDKGNVLEWDGEVRVAQGVSIGIDGAPVRGTYLTTRLDVYQRTGANRLQIHALHGAHHGPPNLTTVEDPLFGPDWTSNIPEASLKGNPYSSTMTVEAVDVPQHENFQLGGAREFDAKATVKVEWQPLPSTYTWSAPKTKEGESVFTGFVGSYSLATARVEFSFTSRATARDATVFTFKSNPDSQRMIFAQVGHEINGTFVAP